MHQSNSSVNYWYCQWIYLDENKVSWCDGRLLLWFDRDPKRMREWNSEFQKPLCVSRGKCEGAVSQKEDRPHPEFPHQNFIGLSCRHRLVFCVSSRSQIGSPTNSTSTILTLYSTVKDHMELVFTAVKCNKQILRPHELYLSCCRYIMIEAESHLKQCPASIWDMYKVYEHIDKMSIGIWHTVYQPYTVIPTLLG